jgi:hypothetical protein
MNVPRVVVATRPTPLQHVIERHGTAGQARFFLAARGQSLDDLQRWDTEQQSALALVDGIIPLDWRRTYVQRRDLDRFLFEPDDIVIALGQDGLVANLAKYLDGQPVIGINPSPAAFDGVLVPHAPGAAGPLLRAVAAGAATFEERTMVRASLDDGQELQALNEVFIGHWSHQSARYRISVGERVERQSSSGLIAATGTGSTGWARSIHGMRHSRLALPRPTDPKLVFFVREAFPSRATGVQIQEGMVDAGQPLTVYSEMDDGGVVFGDGIEQDRLEFTWGARLEVRCASRRLRLVRAASRYN